MPDTNSQDLVWIYLTGRAITGYSSELVWIWQSMLTEGQVDDVDFIHTSPTYLKNGEVKVGAEARGLVLVTDRARLDRVMGRLRVEYTGKDLKAYALPVLAAIT